MEFPETKEKHPGKPLVPLPITDITKLSPGDHVLYRIGEAGYRYDFRSGMVSDIDLREETLGIITLTAKGCKEEKFRFIAFPHLHRVEYSPCRFPAKDAISRARRRRDMNDQLYSPLNNNGHHFVTNAKTGQEYSLSDMILDLKRHRSEEPPNPPEPVAFKRQLLNISDIQPGQHLFIKTGKFRVKQQHVLVEACNGEEQKFTAFIYEGKIKKISVEFPAKHREVFEVLYEPEVCRTCSADVAIKNAEEAMQQLQEAGKKCTSKKEEKKHPGTKDIASSPKHGEGSQLLLECREEINSTQSQNFEGEEAPLHDVMLSQQTRQYESHSVTPASEAEIEMDSIQKEKCNHTSHFVTEVKTGKPLTISESCLFEHDVSPVNLTPASAHSPLDEGDHVAIEIENSEYHHAIVLMNIESKGLLIIPSLNGNAAHDITGDPKRHFNIGFVQLSSAAFRVNYKQSVSPSETKKRAFSHQGQKILNEKGVQFFATWAKRGKAQQVDMTQLRNEKETIKQICPLFKERVTSFEAIKEGDHLIKRYPTYWCHFIISKVMPTESHQKGKVKCIYCLRTKVIESEFSLNVHGDQIYRIQYAETFPPDKAIERARAKVGERIFHPHARMQFVRWAKTGSKEDIEIDCLENLSLPLSKSQIQSFAQLNEGDIIFKTGTWFDHYYIVTEVHSASMCKAVESFHVEIKCTTLNLDPANKSDIFYRLNYHPEACFQQEDSVKMAIHLATDSHSRLKHPLLYSTKTLINYVKTGESGSVDLETLKNERSLSIHYEKVKSAHELFSGDYIIWPFGKKVLQELLLPDTIAMEDGKGEEKSSPFHHMMVADKPGKKDACCVFHCISKGKFKREVGIVKTEEAIFKDGNTIYRLILSERLNPKSSLCFLTSILEGCKERIPPVLPSLENASAEINHMDKDEKHGCIISFQEVDERSIIDHELKLLRDLFVQKTKMNPENIVFSLLNYEHLVMFVIALEYQPDLSFKFISAALLDGARNITMSIAFQAASTATKHAVLKAQAPVGSAIIKPAANKVLSTAAGQSTKNLISQSRAVVRNTIVKPALNKIVRATAAKGGSTLAAATSTTAVRAISEVAVGTATLGLTSAAIETPLLIRGIYKLKRKEKFGQISKTKCKKERAKEVATRTGTVIGSTVGGVAGSFIPVPIVGTMIGVQTGKFIGQGTGNLVGRCIGRAFKDELKTDFAQTQTKLYTEYS